ncbi:MAG TPA: cyclase family protein, partial [Clostridia bacterium]|nr:cyclase family protein [Clostridia bacterium]
MDWLDLSHPIEPSMPVYPGTEPPTFHYPCSIEENGFREMKIDLYTHTGTHLDAPAHIFKEGISLDALCPDYFVGSGLVFDCRSLTLDGEKICLKHFLPYEKELDGKDFLLFNLGWSSKWGREEYFSRYPVISERLARLLAETSLKGVGVDAISVDGVMDQNLPIHRILLGSGKVIIENLANLDQLTESPFILYCFPL